MWSIWYCLTALHESSLSKSQSGPWPRNRWSMYLTSSLFLWKCLSANCGCKWCWLTTTLAQLLSGYKSPGEFNQIINLPQGVEQFLTWSKKKSHIEDFNNEVLPWNCHCTYQRPHRNCLFSVWLPLNQFQSLAFPSTAKCKALKCYRPDSKCFIL